MAAIQQDVLIRAIGKKNKGLEIIDATAGFGHDALRMAAAGHHVMALERDPVRFRACASQWRHRLHLDPAATTSMRLNC